MAHTWPKQRQIKGIGHGIMTIIRTLNIGLCT